MVLSIAAVSAGCNAVFGIHEGVPFPDGSGGAGGSSSRVSSDASSGSTGGGGGPMQGSGGAQGAGGAQGGGGAKGSGGGAVQGMVTIPKGEFGFFNPSEGTTSTSTITHDFDLDLTEVTVGRFKAWVAAGRKAPCALGTCSLDPGGPYEGAMAWQAAWNGQLADDSFMSQTCKSGIDGGPLLLTYGLGDAYPVNCINWYQAAALCFSEGKRLPTEAEWCYAASGRGKDRPFPWGDELPNACDRAVWSVGAEGQNGCSFPTVAGSALNGASLDGALDMAGSLWERLWDVYTDSTPPPTPTTAYTGPSGPLGGSVAHGGGWDSKLELLGKHGRAGLGPESAFADVGFRCARTRLSGSP